MRNVARFHDASKHNTVNLLSAITPTFTGWNTNPGTAAEIAAELAVTLTTSGIQTNNLESNINYDLGSSMRFILFVSRSSVATAAPIKIELSDDDVTYPEQTRSPSTTATAFITIIGKARYIRVIFDNTAAGNTISQLTIRAYRI